MHYIQKLALVLGLCIIIPVAALAEPSGEPSKPGEDTRGMHMTPGHMGGKMQGMNGTMPGHAGMFPGGMGMMQGYSDRAFLSGMIPHHEAAVEMANTVLRDGREAYVKGWAKAVVKDQEAEIELMRKLLAARGGEDADAAAGMRQAMHLMMEMSVSSDPDMDFVAMMVPHHAGALQMAMHALLASNDEKILELAKDIIDKQVDEILLYRQWLAKRRR
jgi:uncharacterized protein (DUF305 family)